LLGLPPMLGTNMLTNAMAGAVVNKEPNNEEAHR
jgi:hypothetical protein